LSCGYRNQTLPWRNSSLLNLLADCWFIFCLFTFILIVVVGGGNWGGGHASNAALRRLKKKANKEVFKTHKNTNMVINLKAISFGSDLSLGAFSENDRIPF
jgi:hypothetical protein